MNTRQINLTTPRLVLRMAGPNRETIRLFAIRIQHLDPDGKGRNVSVGAIQ